MEFDPHRHPHRRQNLLTNEWVLVSPQRTLRPWMGQTESRSLEKLPAYDSECYLCPGNARASGDTNPKYDSTFVFNNDFPAVLPEVVGISDHSELLQREATCGECRVVCFSPRHDLTLAELSSGELLKVVEVWIEQTAELGDKYEWIQVFENKGAAMGCSNPHPHGQLWAGNWLPTIPGLEDRSQRSWSGDNLLLDCLVEELRQGSRVVEQNEDWVLLVPFWAVWPFEFLLVPRRHVLRMPDLTKTERGSLAQILKLGLVRYDNLFDTNFPYSMGWHGAPFGDEDWSHWQLHAHFFPPLLRSESVRKFMVGYEMLAEPQRDITPEQAAEALRSTSPEHYKNR